MLRTTMRCAAAHGMSRQRFDSLRLFYAHAKSEATAIQISCLIFTIQVHAIFSEI